MKYAVRIFRSPATDGFLIRFIRWEDSHGYEALSLATHTWEKRKATEIYNPGDGFTLALGEYEELAQHLVNALYEAGVVPSEYIPSVGEKDAVKKHLNDMRAIVAKQLRMELP